MAKRKKSLHRGWLWILLGPLGMGIFLLASLLVPQVLGHFQPCANELSCIKDLSGTFQPGKTSTFLGKTFSTSEIAQTNVLSPVVLGASTEEKHIDVDLHAQQLYAYQGKQLVYTFPVATGRWHPTPTGEFRIWVKLRYTHMEGGDPSDGTYYNLYNVPYTMFFYNQAVPRELGFSIHGAYWHNNFGHTMSHGCVNMRPEDAAKIFAWADPVSDGSTTYATDKNPGTKVIIYGQPSED